MSSEAKKIELIMWISVLKDKSILDGLLALKQKSALKQKTGRKAGWAKNLIVYVAPDFDETPQGFEDYMLPKSCRHSYSDLAWRKQSNSKIIYDSFIE